MPIPFISITQMREWEKATWVSGQTEAEVIRRVGKCVARLALRLTQPDELILLLAGKGNNGADTRAAREHLDKRRVETLEVADPATDFSRLEALLSLGPALIIDGLFGIGINRPLSADWVRFIQRVNVSNIPVLAVDVPSGLNADSGEPQGAAIEATTTLTVGAPKLGMLQQASWNYVGRLEVAWTVGLAPYSLTGDLQWTLPGDFSDFPPRRAVATHKGTYGHLAIVAGSRGYHGAAVLAARGAQRARPGLVTLHTLEASYPVIASQLQAVMVSPWRPQGGLRQEGLLSPALSAQTGAGSKGGIVLDTVPGLPGSWSALLVGPGLAAADVPEELKTLVRKAWSESTLPVVVDATALGWLRREKVPKGAIRVVTPHPGEAARMLGITVKEVLGDRLKCLRRLSEEYGNIWVVLKGHQTLVGCQEGKISVNSSGNAFMAQGGSGDLLAGYIAGLLAQSELQKDVLTTLSYAVWQHGAAADRLQASQKNWVVEELADELGRE